MVAVAPGSAYGYVTEELHDARVQVTGASHTAVGVEGTVKSALERMFAPLVKGVFERVTFHPAPLPVLSPISNASTVVVVWSGPFSVTAGKMTLAGAVTNDRVLPTSVALTTRSGVYASMSVCITDPVVLAPPPAAMHDASDQQYVLKRTFVSEVDVSGELAGANAVPFHCSRRVWVNPEVSVE